MISYVEAARSLQIPSEQQTRAFAQYVTGAHSWYKHLPILPLSPFVFFLDPNAGRSMVHVSDNKVVFVDNTAGMRGLHYTWQTTKAYRRRFGFWNYEAPYGTSLRYMSGQGVVDTRGAGLRVADADSTCWLEIPASLVEAGTAMVSSLMFHCSANLPDPFEFDDPEGRVRVLVWFRELPADEHAQGEAISAIRRLLALRVTVAYKSERAELERSHKELFPAGKFSRKSWDDVYGSEAYRAAEANWEGCAPRQQEKAMMVPLVAAIDGERDRQIEGMQVAMRRFVEALHAGMPGTA